MTFRYFNLRLVERKWTWIVTYDFARKANLISLLLGLGLKSIYHWKTHFLIIVASLFNSRSDLSSANIFLIDWIPSAISLIYINKRSGPRTDPCETPERTLCLSLSLSVSLFLYLSLSVCLSFPLPLSLQDGALCDNIQQFPVVNYYHRMLHLGCCSSPRFATMYNTEELWSGKTTWKKTSLPNWEKFIFDKILKHWHEYNIFKYLSKYWE